jgi:hypothetical protein
MMPLVHWLIRSARELLARVEIKLELLSIHLKGPGKSRTLLIK